MLRRIIDRPIAVTMCLIALVVLGMLALRFMPVSLMPDIDIPQITVQVSLPGYSAQEVDRKVVASLRGQLMQVAGLKDIRSESRLDAGSIVMLFEPGSNIDLLFIEVNEKIDRAMNSMPKEMERPKVMKASAMDIPAFYLDMYLKTEHAPRLAFAQLGRFARGVVSKRIEQLPQTAMVDMSGSVGTEIVCIPDYGRLRALGMTVGAIESAIQRNNITLEALSVADGLYRYNIHFDSQLLTREDIAGIYMNHDGRLLQLKDLCLIEERTMQRNGLVRHGRHDAITMAIIKQNDAQMEDLQKSMGLLLEDLRKEYPDIAFELTRDQTRLLTYTIENLKGNLYAGALLACLILFLFMRQWRLSALIVLTIPLSLILTLLCFYLIGITLNVISLSGLILGTGMIVDNSIIVIDNIMQKWRGGMALRQAVTEGTGEVFAPMLSSVLTTCSVFIPLIFLSGTAGALFYDQAMGVTIALSASLVVASLVVPVYFFSMFRKRQERMPEDGGRGGILWIQRCYERTMRLVLRRPQACILVLVCAIPLTGWILWHIEKERMPGVEQEDTLMTIDWNTGISAEENGRRVAELLAVADSGIVTSTSMIGAQEFLLSHTKDITASEAVVYMKAASAMELARTKERLAAYMATHYPSASLEYSEPGNIYDLIFSTNEADLEIRLQDQDGRRPGIALARAFTDTLKTRFPDIGIMPVATETNLQYVVDTEQMALYKTNYQQLHGRLKELVNRSRIFDINDGAQSVPVIVGVDRQNAGHVLGSTVLNSEGTEIPLSYMVNESRGEDYKRLQAGNSGEYYSIGISASDRDADRVMKFVGEYVRRPKSELSASYAGGYFSSRKIIGELALVLTVALALLYFILAAQFESFIQPLIILLEMVVDVFCVVLGLWLLGETLNVMSMIGLVVMSGIIINDSILKIDTINRLRRGGMPLLRALMTAGHKRLRPIVMTSLTTILAIVPFLLHSDMGSAIQYPLSLTLIIGMTVGTLVSLFIVPLLYYLIYNRSHKPLQYEDK
ncbi:MAG: efflux RND transporter permease subunit [Bacteroidaceae bacterium]|nr:efflux RND transporter permease subunit [Bacteroidaceae bacterium]